MSTINKNNNIFVMVGYALAVVSFLASMIFSAMPSTKDLGDIFLIIGGICLGAVSIYNIMLGRLKNKE